MKRNEKTVTTKDFELIISRLSENEILNPQAMSFIRGGKGEGDGGGDIPIIPPPPPLIP